MVGQMIISPEVWNYIDELNLGTGFIKLVC